MGNWRTVNIVGTMTEADATTLRDLLDYGDFDSVPGEGYDAPRHGCLGYSSVHPGLCGLGCWPCQVVNACGNLAERDYSVEDVREALEQLLPHAPSMLLKVHCGGEYESDDCVATVSVGEGLAVIGPGEVEKIVGPSEAQMLGNLFRNLYR